MMLPFSSLSSSTGSEASIAFFTVAIRSFALRPDSKLMSLALSLMPILTSIILLSQNKVTARKMSPEPNRLMT